MTPVIFCLCYICVIYIYIYKCIIYHIILNHSTDIHCSTASRAYLQSRDTFGNWFLRVLQDFHRTSSLAIYLLNYQQGHSQDCLQYPQPDLRTYSYNHRAEKRCHACYQHCSSETRILRPKRIVCEPQWHFTRLYIRIESGRSDPCWL